MSNRPDTQTQFIHPYLAMVVIGFGCFIAGMVALSLIPIPVRFKGAMTANALYLTDDSSSASILLTTTPDGTPSISITDAQGNNAFFLTVSEKGYPSLDISGPNEAKVLSLTTGKQPMIRLYDPNADTVAWEVVGDAADPIKIPKP